MCFPWRAEYFTRNWSKNCDARQLARVRHVFNRAASALRLAACSLLSYHATRMHINFSLRPLIRRLGIDIVRWPKYETLYWLLNRSLEHYGVRTTLDVGAHNGEFAQELRSQTSFRGRIISLEPEEKSFATLSRNALEDSNWLPHRIAASNKDDVLDLHVYSSSNFSSVYAPSDFGLERYGAHLEASTKQRVRARRLDSIWEELELGNERIFLKVDTQGHDLSVVEGAGERLSQVPVLLAEAPVCPIYEGVPTLSDHLTTLDSVGYELAGLFTVTRRSDSPRTVEFDAVYLRRDA